MIAWALKHWRGVVIAAVALGLLTWAGCFGYRKAIEFQAGWDARFAAVKARSDSQVVQNDFARAEILRLRADSTAKAAELRHWQEEATTARAAQHAAQVATLALRQQLGAPQSARDSTYQVVIDSLDRSVQYAAAAAHADTMRIIALTHDRDGWMVAALHADSALKGSTGAIGDLQAVAKPERCLFGLIKCPSRTAITVVSLGVGVLAGVVADELLHQRTAPAASAREAPLRDCPAVIVLTDHPAPVPPCP